MSYDERKTLATIISTVVYLVMYIIFLVQIFDINNAKFISDMGFWGYVVSFIFISKILWTMVVEIIFDVIHSMVTKEKKPSIKDERDIAIELKMLKNAFAFFMFGFLLSMISVASMMPPYIMFTIFGLTFILSEIVGLSSKLYFYRRGY